MGQGRVVIARKHTGGTSSGKLISYLILGFIVGISLGYVMMGKEEHSVFVSLFVRR